MAEKGLKILPWTALIGALAALVLLATSVQQRAALLVDTGETRPVVEEGLAALQQLEPPSLDDPAFHNALEQFGQSPYVATVWLFAPDGRVVYTAGSTASWVSADQRATAEMHRVLDALPAGALSREQQTWLLAASAIQAEGEHNDIYRHLLRPITSAGGATLGLVGVAYDVSSKLALPGWGLPVSLVLFLLALGLYWLSLPAWVYLDAARRGERAFVWAVFVFLGNLVALLAYLLVRRRLPAA